MFAVLPRVVAKLGDPLGWTTADTDTDALNAVGPRSVVTVEAKHTVVGRFEPPRDCDAIVAVRPGGAYTLRLSLAGEVSFDLSPDTILNFHGLPYNVFVVTTVPEVEKWSIEYTRIFAGEEIRTMLADSRFG